jgi:Rps23 Pro-64 3,4-dihydroxylase Tpa1-like proline 4-hydroxylase
MPIAQFALHPSIDPERLRATFEAQRRVQITPFLSEQSAEALRAHLIGRDDWREIVNAGEKTFEMDRAGRASLSAEELARMDALIHKAARDGFQYRFETLKISDSAEQRRADRTMLARFAEFLCSAPVLEQMGAVTGLANIAFADAQATTYRPGDFLTAHDDDVDGKNRLAAYVFGLTRSWRAEWGGLLMFHEPGGDIERALMPRFNVLNVFAVPQLHSVSAVAPFAGSDRLSVTGWLRSSRPA